MRTQLIAAGKSPMQRISLCLPGHSHLNCGASLRVYLLTMNKEVAAHPGYVRMVFGRDGAAACRRFADFCREESAACGLIIGAVHDEGSAARLGEALGLATRAAPAGFRLAVVARGASSRAVRDSANAARAAGRTKVKVFRSEHEAAAWLLG